jgi:hypothetical protein
MVRTRKKAIKKGNRTACGASGERPVPMKGLAEMGHPRKSTRVVLRVAEHALLGERKSVDRCVNEWDKYPQGKQAGLDGYAISQALVWTAEPEWQGELSEADSEIAAGSREPEGHFD